jgi:hypothetical protein
LTPCIPPLCRSAVVPCWGDTLHAPPSANCCSANTSAKPRSLEIPQRPTLTLCPPCVDPIL